MRNVTFVTNCWEKDYDLILCSPYLMKNIKNNCYDFVERWVIVNNVNDRVKVENICNRLCSKGLITAYFFSDDFADMVLSSLGIEKSSFRGGYYYSIAELVSIYLCKTEYLLFYKGDCFLPYPVNWIDESINLLERDNTVLVCNPLWNFRHDEVKKESFDENDKFWFSFGFSDQCFLIRTRDFKRKIYNESNDVSLRFPSYGGECFEKRVDSYMRNHGLCRGVCKYAVYIHKNFPKRDDLHRFFYFYPWEIYSKWIVWNIRNYAYNRWKDSS